MTELDFWLRNYRILKDQYQNAAIFKNEEVMEDIAKRIVITQRMIAEYVSEHYRKGDPDCPLVRAIRPDKNITDYSALNLGCNDGFWSE